MPILYASHMPTGANPSAKMLSRKISDLDIVQVLNAINTEGGPDEMLAALDKKIGEYAAAKKPYSMIIEGNYGSTGSNKQKDPSTGALTKKNAWIVEDITKIMDKHKWYPTYFIMEGNGDTTDPEPKKQAITLAQKHAEGKYKFKASRELSLVKSPPLAFREMGSESKEDRTYTDITPNSTSSAPIRTRSASSVLAGTQSSPTLFGDSKKKDPLEQITEAAENLSIKQPPSPK